MAPYSMDLRKRVARAWDADPNAEAIAAKYEVSRAWVHRLIRRRRETGSLAPRKQTTFRRGALDDQQQTKLRALITARPDAAPTISANIRASWWGPISEALVQRQSVPLTRTSGPRTNRVRRQIFIPKPFSEDEHEVMENMKAGLEQSHLIDEPDFRAFRDHPSEVSVTDVQYVDGRGTHPDYWLVSVRFRGAPFARVAISKKGWLLSVQQIPSTKEAEPKSNSWALDAARRMSLSPSNVRRVYFDNNVRDGGSIFQPLFQLDMPDGSHVILTDGGDVFTEVGGTGAGTRLVRVQ